MTIVFSGAKSIIHPRRFASDFPRFPDGLIDEAAICLTI